VSVNIEILHVNHIVVEFLQHLISNQSFFNT